MIILGKEQLRKSSTSIMMRWQRPFLNYCRLSTILNVLDCDTTDGAFKEGIQMIFSSFHDILKKLGVEEIEADGAKFDPDLHHAIKQVEIEGEGDGIVCEVYQRGYKLGDKVIRHAMVVVANP